MQKLIRWDAEKSKHLKMTRGISFEDVISAIEGGKLLDDIINPNKKDYPRQRVYIINIDEYACSVPYVEDKDKIFLKTIYLSRKYTKQYLKNKK